MRNHLCRKLAIEIVCFLPIVTHAHYFLSFHPGRHCIPNKFPRRTPCEIANVVRFENVSFLLSTFGFFSRLCFIQCHDLNRLFGCLCFLPTRKLSRGQHLLIVLAFTCCTYNMIRWHRHLHLEVSKCQCKFATTRELMILPSLEITVHTKTGIPLSHCKKIISVFRKIFKTPTTTLFHAIGYLIIPVHIKNKFLSR